jgi:rubrerythrin
MSETSSNLLKAIAGESMARNKYTYFAEIARKEGYEWVAAVFEETAGNERAHAQEELEALNAPAEMTNTYGIDPLGDTLTNLKHAVAGEIFETETMYPEFKAKAEAEGNTKAAKLFGEIAEVEAKHAERYQILTDRLESGNMFKSEEESEWKCLNCGYIHTGTEAPDKCPLCMKPQAFYMELGVLR